MTSLVVGVVLALGADQALKVVVRAHLGQRSISLGPLGCLRVVQSRIWTERVWGRLPSRVLWLVWLVAAVGVVTAVAILPALGLWYGLLLGGGLSHAVETSVRGSVSDYVCLSFWPAFDLADVALVVGALGLARTLATTV